MNKTSRLSLFTLCIVLFFAACTKKEKQDEVSIKGYLEVEAVCIESIRSEEILFTGYLVDVYNKTQNSGFRHGTVSYKKTLTQTNKDYVAPSQVKFSKITPAVFSQQAMHISGLSYRENNRDVFKANCDIKVLKRLKHQPE